MIGIPLDICLMIQPANELISLGVGCKGTNLKDVVPDGFRPDDFVLLVFILNRKIDYEHNTEAPRSSAYRSLGSAVPWNAFVERVSFLTHPDSPMHHPRNLIRYCEAMSLFKKGVVYCLALEMLTLLLKHKAIAPLLSPFVLDSAAAFLPFRQPVTSYSPKRCILPDVYGSIMTTSMIRICNAVSAKGRLSDTKDPDVKKGVNHYHDSVLGDGATAFLLISSKFGLLHGRKLGDREDNCGFMNNDWVTKIGIRRNFRSNTASKYGSLPYVPLSISDYLLQHHENIGVMFEFCVVGELLGDGASVQL
ncbi:hypothetical protein Tco_0008586 [Tanacetum coccineum]